MSLYSKKKEEIEKAGVFPSPARVILARVLRRIISRTLDRIINRISKRIIARNRDNIIARIIASHQQYDL